MTSVRFAAAVCVCVLLIADLRPLKGSEPDVTSPRKILFDSDPGGDDIFAMLWLQSLQQQGHAEIVAVTTASGNVNGQLTFANACRILALGGNGNVEVGRATGAQQRGDATHIYGSDGMGGLSRTLPAISRSWSNARLSPEIIIEKLQSDPGEITVIAVGPLTNLAAAEEQCPGILSKARELVIMGGTFRRRGNITSQAEFNIHCDPKAAEKVFASRDDLVVLPLDITTGITFTGHHAELVRESASNKKMADFLVELTDSLAVSTMRFRDSEGTPGFHVHDAATLAYLFYPETLLLRRAEIRVETDGRWTRGKTVIDERHGAKRMANAWVAMEVDATNLLAVLVEDLKWLCRTE